MYAAFLPKSAFASAGVPAGAESYDILHRAFLHHVPLAMAPIAGDAINTVAVLGDIGSSEGEAGGHH